LRTAGRSAGAHSTFWTRSNHKVVVGGFGYLPPKILVVAISLHRFDGLLEISVLGGNFRPEFIGCFQARLHDLIAERTKLSAGCNETLTSLRVYEIVPGAHPDVCMCSRIGQYGLIILRERIPFFEIGHHMKH